MRVSLSPPPATVGWTSPSPENQGNAFFNRFTSALILFNVFIAKSFIKFICTDIFINISIYLSNYPYLSDVCWRTKSACDLYKGKKQPAFCFKSRSSRSHESPKRMRQGQSRPRMRFWWREINGGRCSMVGKKRKNDVCLKSRFVRVAFHADFHPALGESKIIIYIMLRRKWYFHHNVLLDRAPIIVARVKRQ